MNIAICIYCSVIYIQPHHESMGEMKKNMSGLC